MSGIYLSPILVLSNFVLTIIFEVDTIHILLLLMGKLRPRGVKYLTLSHTVLIVT